jgi:hypothetical protein
LLAAGMKPVRVFPERLSVIFQELAAWNSMFSRQRQRSAILRLSIDEAPAAQKDPYLDPNSLRFKFRQRRFQTIAGQVDHILSTQATCSILDLGGTETYWRIGGDFLRERAGRIKIRLLNLEKVPVEDEVVFSSEAGDACNLSRFLNNTFDYVHSNSVIEHVGSWNRMKMMAHEVRRLAPHYFLQTPYVWFPIEPHYKSIGYHWLPQNIQASRVLKRRQGFCERQPDIDRAMNLVQHTVLLDKRQFAHLFPDATMRHEIICGITKSLIATR